MNITTWNQFGLGEILLACVAMVGFLSVIVVISTAGKRVDKLEQQIKMVHRHQSLDPDERVLDDTKVGLTDPD